MADLLPPRRIAFSDDDQDARSLHSERALVCCRCLRGNRKEGDRDPVQSWVLPGLCSECAIKVRLCFGEEKPAQTQQAEMFPERRHAS